MSFATRGIRHVFIRNLELPAHIGVYRQEEGRTQPVRINVDLATDELADAQDMLENVVDYHVIEKRIRAIIGHKPGLVEKRMFGGFCLMVRGNLCCGVVRRASLQVGTQKMWSITT